MKIKKIIKQPITYWKQASKKGLRLYRTLFYRGNRVMCGICGWKGSQFFDEKCPQCNAQARTRLVAYALDHFNLVKSHRSLLHIAPNMNEYRYVKKVFSSMVRYDRLDIKNRKQINIIDDVTKPQKLQGLYDLIIVWHVFEHVKDDEKAISELFKVLTPGGHLLVSVPIFPLGNLVTYEDDTVLRKDYQTVHGHYDHCRSCGLDYYQRFENLGFKTETLEVHSIISEDILRFGLQDDHVLWCFTKPKDAI